MDYENRVATFYIDNLDKKVEGFLASGVNVIFDELFQDIEAMKLGDAEEWYEIRPGLGSLKAGARIVAQILGLEYQSLDDIIDELSAAEMRELKNKGIDIDLRIVPGTKEYTGSYRVEFRGVQLEVTLTGGTTGVTGAGTYEIGEEVTITVTPPTGKEIDSFSVNSIDKKGQLVNGEYRFIITADTIVKATYVDAIVPTAIIIEGSASIEIKPSGEATESYTATVRDQNGQVLPDAMVTWSLKEAVAGVSVDIATGEVTVADSTEATQFTLVATSSTHPLVFKEKLVALIRPQNTDATLSDLTVDGESVGDFAKNKLVYALELPAGTTTVPTVAATATDVKANVNITQAAGFETPNNIAIVKVTAEDGTTIQTYTITFTVKANEDQDAPTDLIGIAPTSKADNDGKITGVTGEMEYKLAANTQWTSVGEDATEIIGLAAGTYEVRYSAKTGFNAGQITEVIVPAYVAPEYVVTFSVSDGNGTLTAKVEGTGIVSEALVEEGKTIIFTAVPDTGYQVKAWKVDNGVVEGEMGLTYTLDSLDKAVEVTVEFEKITYTLTYTSEEGGSISGEAIQVVEYGEDGQGVTVLANAGYHFVKWCDGRTDNPRTDTNVTSDITVEAEFAAYVAKRNGQIYSETDGGLEQALIDAQSGDAITLLADYALVDSITVPKGVTLLLPCSETDTGYTSTGFNPDGTSTSQADLSVLYRTLTVPSGKTMTIEGTVMVNAVTGRPNGGHYDQDITGGYSEIALAGDIIVKNGGLLDVFGKITGDGTVEAKDGGSVGDLYVVRNWRGGTNAFWAVNRRIFPFNQYDVHNIEAKTIINAGASYYGNVKMYANNKYYYTRFYQFDQTEGLIKLASNATTIKTYDRASEHTTITISGGAEEIAGSMQIANEDVSTKDYFYPVDGHITLALNNGEYTINNKVKFLPGSSLELGADATLTVKPGAQLVFYDEFIDAPNREDTEYPLRAPAVFILDSTMTVEGAFAGMVDAGANAQIVAGESAALRITSQEMHGYPKDPGWEDEYSLTFTTKLGTDFDSGLAWHYYPTGGASNNAILVADTQGGSGYVDLGGSTDTFSGYTFVIREPGQGTSSIKNVTKNRYYYTIQQAIGLADAGDEIHVGGGTYNESLTVDKSITLVGNPGDESIPGADWLSAVVLNGDGTSENAVRVVGASNVVIKGFSINGYGGSGIVVEGNADGTAVHNIEVSYNTILNVGQNRSGIEVCNVTNSQVCNNFISSNGLGNGIKLVAHAAGTHDIVMTGNAINSNVIDGYPKYGVLIEAVADGGTTAIIENADIMGNSILAAERAILLDTEGGGSSRLKNIQVASNELTSKETVVDVWGKVENLTIINNTLKTQNKDESKTWVSGFATGLGKVNGIGVFSDNTVQADGFVGYGVWIQDSGTADWVINGNLLEGKGWYSYNTHGVYYKIPGSTLEMAGNTVWNWFYGVISEADNTTVALCSNNIYYAGWGVKVEGKDSTVTSFRFNRFYSPYSQYSLLNCLGTQIDARYNYWGHHDGPGFAGNDLWGDILYAPWYTDEDCTETSDGSDPFGLLGLMQLETFILTFDGNGGTPGLTEVEVENEGFVNELPAVSREGYTFIEWNTRADGSGEAFDPETAITEDLILYAVWKEAEAEEPGSEEPMEEPEGESEEPEDEESPVELEEPEEEIEEEEDDNETGDPDEPEGGETPAEPEDPADEPEETPTGPEEDDEDGYEETDPDAIVDDEEEDAEDDEERDGNTEGEEKNSGEEQNADGENGAEEDEVA